MNAKSYSPVCIKGKNKIQTYFMRMISAKWSLKGPCMATCIESMPTLHGKLSSQSMKGEIVRKPAPGFTSPSAVKQFLSSLGFVKSIAVLRSHTASSG